MIFLLVDDEVGLGEVWSDHLESLGYLRYGPIATSGEQALAAAQENCAPQIALVDINLAGTLSGVETAGRLRIKWPEIHILFISASRREDLPELRFLPFPFNYLEKPFTLAQLAAAVKESFVLPLAMSSDPTYLFFRVTRLDSKIEFLTTKVNQLADKLLAAVTVPPPPPVKHSLLGRVGALVMFVMALAILAFLAHKLSHFIAF